MKLNAVLLAAGNSTRFGSNKLLHELNGKHMYRHIVDVVLSLNPLFSSIVLVTQYDEIIKQIEGLPLLSVKNTKPEFGISHSIKLGIKADESADAWLFLMCDQPHIMPGTISDLILKYRESGKKIGCIFYGKYYGSPAIFSKEYEDELESLTGDSGGKKIIKNHIEDVFFFYCPDDSEFKDYDYPGA